MHATTRQYRRIIRPVFTYKKIYLEPARPMDDVERGTATDGVLNHRQAHIVVVRERGAKSRLFAQERFHCYIDIMRQSRLAEEGTGPGTADCIRNFQPIQHRSDFINDGHILLVTLHASPP